MKPQVLEVLKELEDLKTEDNKFWNVDWEVGEFLAQKVEEFKPQTILEIGTSTGFSAIWMAQATDEYRGQLITVDSAKKRYNIALDYFKKSGLKNINFLEGHAPEVFEKFEEDFVVDMVFMDASKKDYLKFYKGLEPFFADEVLIIADNVISHSRFMGEYLAFVRSLPNAKSELLDLGDGLEVTMIKKAEV